MITVVCEKCGKHITAAGQHAGKKGKCPGCGEILVIPAASSQSGSILTQPTAPRGGLEALTAAEVNQGETLVPEEVLSIVNDQLAGGQDVAIVIPEYASVMALGYVYIIAGILSWVATVVCLFQLADVSAGQTALRVYWQSAIACAIGGLVLMGMGQLCFCIRDMARNSFYLQRIVQR